MTCGHAERPSRQLLGNAVAPAPTANGGDPEACFGGPAVNRKRWLDSAGTPVLAVAVYSPDYPPERTDAVLEPSARHRAPDEGWSDTRSRKHIADRHVTRHEGDCRESGVNDVSARNDLSALHAVGCRNRAPRRTYRERVRCVQRSDNHKGRRAHWYVAAFEKEATHLALSLGAPGGVRLLSDGSSAGETGGDDGRQDEEPGGSHEGPPALSNGPRFCCGGAAGRSN